MIDTSNVNQLKSFLGGDATSTHVKCKADKIIKSVPVLMTTNIDPWYQCTGEKQALLNRMHYYKLNSLMPSLVDAGHLNPRKWWFLLHADIGKPSVTYIEERRDEWDPFQENDAFRYWSDNQLIDVLSNHINTMEHPPQDLDFFDIVQESN